MMIIFISLQPTVTISNTHNIKVNKQIEFSRKIFLLLLFFFLSILRGKELDTIARRYDFKPLYIEREDEMRPTRNDTHVFFQEVKSDFIVSKDPIESFCYLCSIGEHVHEHRKARDESQVNQSIQFDSIMKLS